MSDEQQELPLNTPAEAHLGRREYDPIVAQMLHNQGQYAARIDELLDTVRELSEAQKKADARLNRHMMHEEHKIDQIAQNMPTAEQLLALNTLIESQHNWQEFWQDVRKSILKKFFIGLAGLAAVAILWYLWQLGHGIDPHTLRGH